MRVTRRNVDAANSHELVGIPPDGLRVPVGDGHVYGANPRAGRDSLHECLCRSFQPAGFAGRDAIAVYGASLADGIIDANGLDRSVAHYGVEPAYRVDQCFG